MQMVELILQGVKGFPSQTRIALAPGQTVLRADREVSLWPAIEALLFVDGRSPAELSLDSQTEEVCRAAITLRATDGTIWRVVRDLRGATALQRLDASGKFEKIASSLMEIGPYLRTQIGLPSRSLYEEMFTLGESDFPTARAARADAAGAHPAGLQIPAGFPGAASGGLQKGTLGGFPPAAGGLQGPFPTGGLQGSTGGLQGLLPGGLGGAMQGGLQGGLQPAVQSGIHSALAMEPTGPAPAQRPAAELIPELERELEAALELEEVQRRLDEAQSRLFELDEKLQVLPRVQEASAAADRELSRFVTHPPIPGDLGEELEAFRRAEARRDAAMARLAEDRAALEDASAGPMPTPVWEDRRFWAAALLGVVFLAAAIFTRWKVLSLLSIPSFGAVAVFAYLYTSALQGRERYGRRKALFSERETKVVKEHEAETQVIRDAMRLVGVETPAELEAWVNARREARAAAEHAASRLAEVEADPELAAAQEERRRIAAEVAALETELSTKAAAAYRSPGEIQRELELLRSQGEGAANGAAPTAGSAPLAAEAFGAYGAAPVAGGAAAGGFGGLAAGPFGGAPAMADPSALLLERMEELFHASRDGLLASFGSRASKYLEALTGRRYTTLSWGSSGGLHCAGEEGSARFLELEPRHQDVAWLALRLTVIEHYVGRYPLPVILEDPFASLSEQRQALLSRMLKGIAAKTQVVHRTRLDVMASGATVVELA